LNVKLLTKAQQMSNGGPAEYQGFIAALKESFGFIETLNHDKEIFFHFRYGYYFLLYLDGIISFGFAQIFRGIFWNPEYLLFI